MPPDHANSPSKCTPCIPKPYAHKPGPKAGKSASKDTLRTSSFSNAPSSWQNLTLHDWLRVVNWFNENQPISQEAAVQHFAMRPWFSTRHLFPAIWARRGGSKIRKSSHQHQHHCHPKESMLSQDQMLNKPYGCGWSIWRASARQCRNPCWLKSGLDSKTCSM